MKTIKQTLLSGIALEMSLLSEDKEGKLRGGFAGMAGMAGINGTNTNCTCKNENGCSNTNCTNVSCENKKCTNSDCSNSTCTNNGCDSTATATGTKEKGITIGGLLI